MTNKVRTTVIVPQTVDQNWELCAVKMRISKGEVMIKALPEFLIKEGFQPDKRPIIRSVKY